MNAEELNRLNASRKADREKIAAALVEIAERLGAEIERRDDPPNPGFHGQSICLRFDLNGVGAMIDIDNLHGGDHGLLSWYNNTRQIGDAVQNFNSRFNSQVGDHGSWRPHHKATSIGDWARLAMSLESGLTLAQCGEAFEERKAA